MGLRSTACAAVALLMAVVGGGTGGAGPEPGPGPRSGAGAPVPAGPVPAAFLGDASIGGYGIAPVEDGALLCVRARENLPDVIEDQLADQSILLDITADVSCAGARLNHVWEPQDLGGGLSAAPQKRALTKETRLVVVGLGAGTAGVGQVLKQCSARLRGTEGSLLPDAPVDPGSPAGECAAYFARGAGAAWLEARFEETGKDLDKLFSEISSESPSADVVLVGYPRLVPKDRALCRTDLPGGADRPLADVPEAAWPLLDDTVQARLNTLMAEKAKRHGAHFVDLYAATGSATACDGTGRAVGGLLEPSQVTLHHQTFPWFLGADETGRDANGDTVAQSIAAMYGRGPA
ncbi:SGNH/GDSL hydrolase family protein [Streptomyces sp. NPDC053755]|uniref:SGNH/GDSL hydrolase family protein n=1 Tax=Streptomyces sp. NPDC053755 TaxID=3155815 RepID=UPI00343A9578